MTFPRLCTRNRRMNCISVSLQPVSLLSPSTPAPVEQLNKIFQVDFSSLFMSPSSLPILHRTVRRLLNEYEQIDISWLGMHICSHLSRLLRSWSSQDEVSELNRRSTGNVFSLCLIFPDNNVHDPFLVVSFFDRSIYRSMIVRNLCFISKC